MRDERRETRDESNRANKITSRFGANKKKTVTALCLVSLMAFMWIRVLFGKRPGAAEAALEAQKTSQQQPESELKISFIQLPEVKGRNDTLAMDFFTVNRWHQFFSGGAGEVDVISKYGDEEYIKAIADKLKLQAIGLGQLPQAFINDKLLMVGDSLFVQSGADTYECEVVEIKANAVFIKCGQAEIELKLIQELVGD